MGVCGCCLHEHVGKSAPKRGHLNPYFNEKKPTGGRSSHTKGAGNTAASREEAAEPTQEMRLELAE